MITNCNLYLPVVSSLPLFQEHYQYLYKAMLSLVGSTDNGMFCSYMDRHGRILKTDKGNPVESMESLVWRLQKTKRDEFVWQTFLEAFIFARLVDNVKEKKSLKTFCTLMKNSFDIYFCCFLLSCWVSQLILQYTYTKKMQLSTLHYIVSVTVWCLDDFHPLWPLSSLFYWKDNKQWTVLKTTTNQHHTSTEIAA